MKAMAKAKRVTQGAAHVVTIKKKVGEREYRTHLLRRSYRENGKVCNETLANLSHLGDEKVELLRRALAGEHLVSLDSAVQVTRSLPHGHVAAVLSMARALDFERLIDREPSRKRSLAMAIIVQRVLAAGSKLASARSLADSTLAEELDVVGADEDDLYAALDYLAERQEAIEKRLSSRHLQDGTIVLYDVSSSYFEGRTCPLAARGYSRDQRRGSLQIIYGLLCNRDGVPVAIEVFEGNTLDHQTVVNQIEKLKERFGLSRVVVVSDRGMVTVNNLAFLRDSLIDWITGLKAPQVKALAEDGSISASLFDHQNLACIERHEDYPGERLVLCRNPLLAAERTRKREELLAATEAKLLPIQQRVQRGTLRGKDKIGLAVGAVVNKFKMSKHIELRIDESRLEFSRKSEQIEREAALDGIYVLRTSIPPADMDSPEVIRTYKRLQSVERAFRTLKSVDLEIRPIYHRLEKRVRAHVFACMLSYYLEYHLRRAWAELLFADDEPVVPDDPVTQATQSPAAQRKAATKQTKSGGTAHSFQTLLAHLATQARCTMTIAGVEGALRISEPTPLQAQALELLRKTPTAA
jgi:transposase